MQLCTRHDSRSDIYYSKNDHRTLPDRRHGHGTATNTTWTGAVRRARRSDSRHHKLLYSYSYLPALTPEQIHPISRGVGDCWASPWTTALQGRQQQQQHWRGRPAALSTATQEPAAEDIAAATWHTPGGECWEGTPARPQPLRRPQESRPLLRPPHRHGAMRSLFHLRRDSKLCSVL